jgi:DNA repair exonuclease SbcCD ATPase subunit
VNYFAPGFREIVRVVQRTLWRFREWLARQQLAGAEKRLGLLGWQQADFDPETQRQVDAIQNVEREQADLANRAAELAHGIEKLTADRAVARAEFDQQRAPIEAERARAREPLAEIERALAVIRERPTDVGRRIADLERQLRETDALYTKLLGVQPQTPQVRDEILRLRERLIAIPNEVSDIKAQQLRATSDIQEHEQQRSAIEKQTAEFDRQLRELKSQADKRDADFASQIKALEKDRARAEASAQRLERAKHNPYREIGRVLADSGVAPLNQPQALARVQSLRSTIVESQSAVSESLHATAAEDASMLRISLTLWGVISVAALLVVGALL